jgi:Bacterial dnaA protein helix-turn-helix
MHFLSQEIIHLYLRGRHPHALMQDEEDWRALTAIAKRMLFWCGGSIHGCRCEGHEMRFAVEIGHASVGAMAHHISGAYAIHLLRRRGWTGSIFKHYIAIPIDTELFLDDLVIWLHRPPESGKAEGAGPDACWTADSAYLIPKSLTWITTERVLAALSPGGAGRSVYIRRKTQPIAPEVEAILTGRTARRSRQASDDVRARRATRRQKAPERSNIEEIARFVAEYSHLSYDDMHSASRKRALSRAKVVAAVLCTRNGASVAAVARLFGRSRSTLIERAERYRETQPQLFDHVERALEVYLERKHGRQDHQSVRLRQTHFDRQCAGPADGVAIHTGARACEVEDGVALSKR